jgi:hypothetical protein
MRSRLGSYAQMTLHSQSEALFLERTPVGISQKPSKLEVEGTSVCEEEK